MSEGHFITGLIVVGVIFIIGLTFAFGALVGPGDSEHLLQTQGFTNIHLQAKHIWLVELRGCSDSDNVRFDFTATNPLGQQVSVHVCDGILKGATVRG